MTKSCEYVWVAVYQSLMLIPFVCVWLKAMAEESGDGDKAKVIQDELNDLEERAEALDRQRTKSISAIRLGNYNFLQYIFELYMFLKRKRKKSCLCYFML